MPDLTAADLDAAVQDDRRQRPQHGHRRGGCVMADSKRYKALKTKVEHMKLYPVQDALKIIKDNATAKFDESVDVSINLGIDAKKSDQAVRGSIVLPQGTGKSVRVAVFAQGDQAQAAARRRRRHRRLRGPRRRDQGRQDGFRRRDRDAGRDARRRPARPDPRSARPDAEPESRHGDAGRRRSR